MQKFKFQNEILNLEIDFFPNQMKIKLKEYVERTQNYIFLV